MTQASIAPKDITGLILAGGLARRMGGVDKGLQALQGLTLVEHVLQRMRGQVAYVGINANRSLEHYEALNIPVWPDANADFAGPLAGFAAGLTHCTTPYLLTAPCDTPYLPLDLATRLGTALQQHEADIAMASAPEVDKFGQLQLRTQPVFCLIKTSLLQSLLDFMQSGGRKIDAWTAQHHTVQVPFNLPTDHAHSFFNINTLQQLQGLEKPST